MPDPLLGETIPHARPPNTDTNPCLLKRRARTNYRGSTTPHSPPKREASAHLPTLTLCHWLAGGASSAPRGHWSTGCLRSRASPARAPVLQLGVQAHEPQKSWKPSEPPTDWSRACPRAPCWAGFWPPSPACSPLRRPSSTQRSSRSCDCRRRA